MARELKVGIEIDFDNRGAIRGFRQTTDALQGVETAGTRAASGMSTFAKAAIAAGIAFVGAKIASTIRDAVSASAEQERAFASLAHAMQTVGVSYGEVAKETQGMLAQLQATTKYGDDEAAGALQRLTVITGSYESALKLLAPTLDFATSMQIDLATASRLAGQAATGMTGTLSRYGIVLDDATKKQLENASAMEKSDIIARELNRRFGGAAAAEIATFSGKIAQLRNYWGDLLETLGDVITKSNEVSGGIDMLITALKQWTEWAKDFGEALAYVFNFDYAAGLRATFDTIGLMFLDLNRKADETAIGIITAMGSIPGPVGAAFREIPLGPLVDDLKKIESASKLLSRVLVSDYRKATENAERASKEFRDAVEGLSIGLGDGSGGLTEALEGVTEASEDTERAMGKAADATKEWNDSMWQGPKYLEGYITTGRSFTNVISDLSVEMSMAEAAGRDMSISFEDTANAMQSTFSDLLGRGFTGELESFSEIWEEMWAGLARSMVKILSDAIEKAFSADGGGLGQLFGSGAGSLHETISQNRLAFGLGGAGAVYGASQQGGWGGALQGAMGGAATGAAIGSLFTPAGTLVGAIIGAVVGGAIGYFGGEDDTRYRVRVGTDPSSAYQTRLSGPGPSGELRHAQMMEMVSQYRASIMGMNSILRLFEEGDLFDMIRNAPGFSFEGDASFDEIATIFREQWLPDAMTQMFAQAINVGLTRLNVDEGTLDQLWGELAVLTGTDRMAALEAYIGAVVSSSRLLDDMDWNTIMDESRMDSMTAFFAGMQEAVDAVGNQMLGLDSMSLIERAGQAQTINQLISQARNAEIQMLRQIDQLQKSINDSIDAQLESIRTGGMSESELQGYYLQQIESIMSQLRSGVTSPEMLQSLMGDLQRYTGAYQSMMGDALYESMNGTNWSGADYLTYILEEARGLSNDAFEAMRDQIRETNDALIAELQRLIDALTHYGDSVATGSQQPAQFDANIGIDVEIRPSEWFESWVETRINRAIVSYDAQQFGPH